MQFYRGRLIDHAHLRVRDLDASHRFYVAALGPLGLVVETADDHFQVDELWVDKADAAVSHVHLAFQAGGPEQVKAFYAAFVFDPDGNSIEAVFHGPNRRSSSSVVINAL